MERERRKKRREREKDRKISKKKKKKKKTHPPLFPLPVSQIRTYQVLPLRQRRLPARGHRRRLDPGRGLVVRRLRRPRRCNALRDRRLCGGSGEVPARDSGRVSHGARRQGAGRGGEEREAAAEGGEESGRRGEGGEEGGAAEEGAGAGALLLLLLLPLLLVVVVRIRPLLLLCLRPFFRTPRTGLLEAGAAPGAASAAGTLSPPLPLPALAAAVAEAAEATTARSTCPLAPRAFLLPPLLPLGSRALPRTSG